MITRPSFSSMKILLADDNDANCLIGQTILERAGHSVTIARNGFHAIGLTKLAVFDLIILDVLMPVMDGLQTLHRIRQGKSQNENALIFALTAFCDRDDRQHFQSLGFDAVLTKPVRGSDLDRAFASLQAPGCPSGPNLKTDPPLSQISLLNADTIRLLCDYGTREKLEDIESRFWESIQTKCQTIKSTLPAALQGDDFSLSEFRRAVHAVKSACDSIGLTRVAHISRNLRNAPPSDIPDLMHGFINALRDSRPILTRALSGSRQLDPAVQMRGEDQPKAAHHR